MRAPKAPRRPIRRSRPAHRPEEDQHLLRPRDPKPPKEMRRVGDKDEPPPKPCTRFRSCDALGQRPRIRKARRGFDFVRSKENVRPASSRIRREEDRPVSRSRETVRDSTPAADGERPREGPRHKSPLQRPRRDEHRHRSRAPRRSPQRHPRARDRARASRQAYARHRKRAANPRHTHADLASKKRHHLRHRPTEAANEAPANSVDTLGHLAGSSARLIVCAKTTRRGHALRLRNDFHRVAGETKRCDAIAQPTMRPTAREKSIPALAKAAAKPASGDKHGLVLISRIHGCCRSSTRKSTRA